MDATGGTNPGREVNLIMIRGINSPRSMVCTGVCWGKEWQLMDTPKLGIQDEIPGVGLFSIERDG